MKRRPGELRALVLPLHAKGMTVAEIAERLGAAPNSVYNVLRIIQRTAAAETAPSAAPTPVVAPAPITLQLAVALTGGTYAGRAALARRFGVREAVVLQAWHRHRAGVR